MIEEDESDLEATANNESNIQTNKTLPTQLNPSKNQLDLKNHPYLENSLYSPLQQHNGEDLSETQYHGVDNHTPSNVSSFNSWIPKDHRKDFDKFTIEGEKNIHSYRKQWDYTTQDQTEQNYMSSGLNSKEEIEILYAARGMEISKLTAEIQQLHHTVALLGTSWNFVGIQLNCVNCVFLLIFTSYFY